MREISKAYIFLVLFLCSSCIGFSQSCPQNIGFELGDFTGWTCFTGNVSQANGVNVTLSPPDGNRHIILQNTIPQEKDYYGKFPVNCPNGSGYSVKLGNSGVQAQAERISYSFTVPIDKNEYSFIYNYAIVFQNPGHAPEEQPKFTASVFDQTAGQYLGCGAFEFVASSGLPGFEVSAIDPTIWYKPWSPVTVKLVGCAGKTISIEFTTNDCTRGGHFGYAYIDVNENCTSPVTGNVYCNGATSVTLQAPFGFQDYNWYTADFVTWLGNGYTLKLDPIPPIGTKFAVQITPYPGLGCLDTLYTTIQLSPEGFYFTLADTVNGCAGQPVNLTATTVTQGSSPGLTFSYFLDSIGLEYLAVPSQVTEPGLFYIKAVNSTGCTETKPVNVSFRDIQFNISDPPEGCSPNTIDITASDITAGNPSNFTYSYWKDAAATIPLPSPNAIDISNTYYIKAEDAFCSLTKPVDVILRNEDDLRTNSMENCGSVKLDDPAVTNGSLPIFTFSYWQDNGATIPIPDNKVTASGTYFVKGTLAGGCNYIKPVDVTILPLPLFTVINPDAVTAPEKVDITHVISGGSYNYTFWKDTLATQPLLSPAFISSSGRFFIKAINTEGCIHILPVNVVVHVPFHPVIKFPNAFSPNNDGVNDGFRIEIAGNIAMHTFKIFNRWGQVVFDTKDPSAYWLGQKNGKPEPVGTYYWVMELVNNNNNDFYRKTGSITLVR